MRLKQKIENNVQKSCDKIDSLFVVIKRANAYSEEAGNLNELLPVKRTEKKYKIFPASS